MQLIIIIIIINPLTSELNPICHLLTLLGAQHIFHVSRIRVKTLSNSLNNLRVQTKQFSNTFASKVM